MIILGQQAAKLRQDTFFRRCITRRFQPGATQRALCIGIMLGVLTCLRI